MSLPSDALPNIDAIASIFGNGNMSYSWFRTRAAPGSDAKDILGTESVGFIIEQLSEGIKVTSKTVGDWSGVKNQEKVKKTKKTIKALAMPKANKCPPDQAMAWAVPSRTKGGIEAV
jgi:hypothetical protein